MMKRSKRIKIPADERKFISPEIRSKLFKDLCKNYQDKMGLNLLYGYLNSDPELMVDYCLIFKVRNNNPHFIKKQFSLRSFSKDLAFFLLLLKVPLPNFS